MINGMPNRPLYFYQKDIFGLDGHEGRILTFDLFHLWSPIGPLAMIPEFRRVEIPMRDDAWATFWIEISMTLTIFYDFPILLGKFRNMPYWRQEKGRGDPGDLSLTNAWTYGTIWKGWTFGEDQARRKKRGFRWSQVKMLLKRAKPRDHQWPVM